MSTNRPIGIVDIFAGPGGLSEGFASVGDRDNPPFRIALSIEKDAAACRTLRVRSAVHEMNNAEFDRYIDVLNLYGHIDENLMEEHFPEVWERSEGVVHEHELSDANRLETESLLDSVMDKFDATGLIGGPPCQVYSLVGRARNARNHMYLGDDDHRHTLYKQYIHVLEYLNPAFFVMENVKGMLSSEHQSGKIFPLVRNDLQSTGRGYTLFALAPSEPPQIDLTGSPVISDHREFIVRAENFGVPQRRHRIIIVGIRNDVVGDAAHIQSQLQLVKVEEQTTAGKMLTDLPVLRSGLSRENDSAEQWNEVVTEAHRTLLELDLDDAVRENLELNLDAGLKRWPTLERAAYAYSQREPSQSSNAIDFVRDARLNAVIGHETRSHIRADLARYLFAAAFASIYGYSPKQADFPTALAPNHKNWQTGKFNDRFRVQVINSPSTTITSHISKDGHYYIHPDVLQARSLTVREAARLQTFPDDYIFQGNRTQQYHQVGNAVPPFLAQQIARQLINLFSTEI